MCFSDSNMRISSLQLYFSLQVLRAKSGGGAAGGLRRLLHRAGVVCRADLGCLRRAAHVPDRQHPVPGE